jgi:hypothetical protein
MVLSPFFAPKVFKRVMEAVFFFFHCNKFLKKRLSPFSL